MFRYLNNIRMKKLSRAVIMIAALTGTAVPAMAQGPKESSMNNPLALTLVIIIATLALIIGMLAYVVYGAAEVELKKQQQQKKDKAAALTVLALFISTVVAAQGAPAPAPVPDTIGGLSPSVFYILLVTVLVEVAAIFFLLFQLRFLLDINKKRMQETVPETAGEGAVEYKPAKPQLNWWDKFNKFRPAEQEADIDLGHNYDGIRELDNRLPPWWLYGFYVTIIFSVVYLYRSQVSHAAPSPTEEYKAAVVKADAELEERLKNQKNKVDENTVVLLTDKAELEKGKAIFTSICVTCHGKNAEGNAGPNLTDDYWIHGGSINDIFKTVKYGYPEKSMPTWKEQLTPIQIAQVASYVKSLRGTNPPGAQPPKGELYVEDGGNAHAADSTVAVKADSTAKAAK